VLGVMAAPMAQATVTPPGISPGLSPFVFAGGSISFTATVNSNWILRSSGGAKGYLDTSGTTSLNGYTTVTYYAPATVSSSYVVNLNVTNALGGTATQIVMTLEPTTLTKAAIAGLTAMGDDHWVSAGGLPNNNMNEIYTHQGVYAGAVINVLWSQLEPSPGLYDFSAIDGVLSPWTSVDYSATGTNGLQGLAEIAAQSSYNPNVKAKIRLRVDGPPTAPGTPNYVLNYGKTGTPGGVAISSGGNQIGAYWANDTQTALQNLQTALAAYYDANPEMVEVTVASCSSLDGEPYIEAKDSTSLTNLHGETDSSTHGAYNDANRTYCFENAGNPYTVWKASIIDSDYNQFTDTNGCFPTYSSGCTNADASIPIAAMVNLKGQFSGRGSLANHDLPGGTSYPLPTKNGLGTFYPAMASYGAPIEFQTTVGLDGLGACQAVELGIRYNMTEMEVHQTQNAEDGGSGSAATCLNTAQLGQLSTLISTRNYSWSCSGMDSYTGCPH